MAEGVYAEPFSPIAITPAMHKHMQPVSVWETDSAKRTFTDVESAARFLLEK